MFLVICLLARKAGYHILFDTEERYLPPVLGLVTSTLAFVGTVNYEIRLAMHVAALKDRHCESGSFRFEPVARQSDRPRKRANR